MLRLRDLGFPKRVAGEPSFGERLRSITAVALAAVFDQVFVGDIDVRRRGRCFADGERMVLIRGVDPVQRGLWRRRSRLWRLL